jgi:uncharacterized protein with PQ loop repeat
MVFLQLLSLSVNVLCLIQKLPQIIRIYQSKNVDSISVSSVLLEETAYTLILTYNLWRNYPLSTFFEYIFLFLQNLLLLWALATYSTQGKDKQTDRSRPLYGILIFCLYVLASITGLLPSAWMSICTVRNSIINSNLISIKDVCYSHWCFIENNSTSNDSFK